MTIPSSADSGESPRRPICRPTPRRKDPAAAVPVRAALPPSTLASPHDQGRRISARSAAGGLPGAASRRQLNRSMIAGGICLSAAAVVLLAVSAIHHRSANGRAEIESARQEPARRRAAEWSVQLPAKATPGEDLRVSPGGASGTRQNLQPVAEAKPAEPIQAEVSPLKNLVSRAPAIAPDTPGPHSPDAPVAGEESLAESSAGSDPLSELPQCFHLPLPQPRGRERTFCDLGPLRLPAGQSISFGLLGGEQALGGEGGFEIEPSETPRGARVLMATAGGTRVPGRIVSVARLAVADDRLKFRWLVDDTVADAVYLRNCVLRVAVGDSSRHVALRVPVRVPSLVVDVRNGGVAFQGRVEHLPRHDSVWLEMTGLPPRFPAHEIDGARLLAADHKTSIRLLGESQRVLLVLQVAFSARRHGLVTVVVRPLTPDGRRFDAHAAERQLATLQAQLQVLRAQYQSLSEAGRSAIQPQYRQQSAALEQQIAAYLELDDACRRLLAAPLAFRVFLRSSEADLDLICGTPEPVHPG